jgi:hypothetical protein
MTKKEIGMHRNEFKTTAAIAEGVKMAGKGGRTRRSLKAFLPILVVLVAAFAFAGGAGAMVNEATNLPWIASDQADYSPGSTVHLTGGNWQPGEDVQINTNDTIGNTWSQTDHATADASGNVTDDVTLPDSFVASYTVTATGASGATATATFTDGNVNVRAQSGAAAIGVTFPAGSVNVFNSGTCGGSVVSSNGSFTTSTSANTFVNSGVGAASGQSARLTAPSPVTIGSTTYTFHDWSVNNNATLVSTSGTSACFASAGTPALTLIATYTASTAFTVTASAGANGSISPSGSVSVNSGATTAFTVTPATGYHISTVTGCGGTLVGSTYTTGAITADCTVTASFAINTYTVTPSAGTHGSLTPATAQTVNYNATTAFTVTPDTGYHINTVTGCGGTLSGFTFTTNLITADCTVTASFAIDTRTITASAGTNGSISPSGSVSVNYGSDQTFTFTPDSHYHVLDVTVDGVSQGPSATYTFTNVTANHTIAVSFAIDTRTLTYTAVGTHGSIVGASPQTVNYDTSGSAVTATPGVGYHFVSWSDGVLTASRTDTHVTADISVSASFAINTYTLTYTAVGTHGSIVGASPQTVNYDTSGSAVTATPNLGYSFVSWSDGVLTASRTDTHVTANVSVSASFADVTPPTISGTPGDITTQPTSLAGATVTYTAPTATDLADGTVSVTCSPASGSTFALGTTLVTCSAHDAAGNYASTHFNVNVLYNWTGFFQPLNPDPTVCNVVKAGSAIPLKFSLGGNQGMSIFANGYPFVSTGTCAGASLDPITDGETVTAGNSNLNYDATADQYVYVWKTDKSWAGKAVRLTIVFADGTTHYARFSFTK